MACAVSVPLVQKNQPVKAGATLETDIFKSNVRKNQQIKIDIVIKKLSAHFDVSLSFFRYKSVHSRLCRSVYRRVIAVYDALYP